MQRAWWVLAVVSAVGVGAWFRLAYDDEAHKFSNELARERARAIVGRVLPREAPASEGE